MKQYIKNNIIKTGREIVIIKNGIQTINPTEEMILADGWVEYTPPVIEETEELLKIRARHKMRNKILTYDSSEEINSFYINDFNLWLDKATRVGLKLRFDAEIASGKTETILWYEGSQFPLDLNSAIHMLNSLELYASACYDNTQLHIAAIKDLKTVEEIEAYDYRVGYPEKLHF